MKYKICLFSFISAGLLVFQGLSATVSFDSDGAALVDGTRTFVYGAFRNPDASQTDFTSLTAAQFNLVHDAYFAHAVSSGYSGTDISQWLTEAQAYLDAAAAAGVGVAMSLPREVVLSQDTGNIGLIVNTLEFKPALWFWILMEEPTEIPGIAATIQAANNMVKANDTMHPTVIIDSYTGLSGQSTVGTHCDTIWAKNHRVPFSQTALYQEVSNINSMYGSKVVWAVCQVSDEIINTDRTGLYPAAITLTDDICAVTPRSLRAQAHAAIAGGAMGVIYDIPDTSKHDIKTDTPQLWQGIVDLGDEIQELAPALLSQDSVPAFSYGDPGWTHGKKNRIRGIYGDIENDPIMGLPSKDHVVRWSRGYQGNLYIGMTVDYMCFNQREIALSFTFSSVRQHPGNKTVIQTTPNLNVSWDEIPVSIWDVHNNNYIQFLLNETDTVVWSFEP